MVKYLLTLSAAFMISTAIGCGDDHDHDHHGEHSPNEEACEHMKDGPATALSAGADAAGATDTTHEAWEHKRVDLTLVASGDSFVGFVKYEAEAAGDYLFFVNNDAVLKVGGASAEATASVSECSEVGRADTFELEVGEHVVEVTSSSETVQLVVEVSSGEGHDDH